MFTVNVIGVLSAKPRFVLKVYLFEVYFRLKSHYAASLSEMTCSTNRNLSLATQAA